METPSIRLAPMAGITDWPFRLLCFEQGCDLAYTEMVSALGYIYAPPTSRATLQLITLLEDEGPVYVQVFGKEAGQMAEAARRLEALGRFQGVDINMGCPAHKVANSGEGSGLMRNLPLAAEMIHETRKKVTLPLTVKMRLGWDHEHITCLELAHIAQEEGVDAIAVHGRTRQQHYSGQADWDWIARVKQSVSIPVFANGDVFTPEDGIRLLEHTQADGLLIGRGSLGNPWIFSGIKKLLTGETYTPPTLRERVDMALRHARMLVSWKTEPFAIKEMRKHVSWYVTGVRGAAQMRVMANQAVTYAELEEALAKCLEQAEKDA